MFYQNTKFGAENSLFRADKTELKL